MKSQEIANHQTDCDKSLNLAGKIAALAANQVETATRVHCLEVFAIEKGYELPDDLTGTTIEVQP